MRLAVVVPTLDRLDNLRILAKALTAQKEADSFEVVIVDDGSTDGTKAFIEELGHLRGLVSFRYMSGGPNKGFRGGRARNIGVFNSDADRFVFIDSDVIPNQFLMHYYQAAAKAQPDAIIVGRYFYTPRIEYGEHPEILWESSSYEDMFRRAQEYCLRIDLTPDVSGAEYGLDLGRRPDSDYTDDTSVLRTGCGLGALSGNVSYPVGLFWEIGGFDERIIGHGGEDADAGLTADVRGVRWLFYKPLFGFHIWHSRDQERNAKSVQANIAYIDAKHGVGMYKSAKKWTDSRDWSSPEHYHKHLGCVIMKVDSDPTVYAVRLDEKKRLGISNPRWLIRLGFDYKDVLIVDSDSLAKHMLMGATPDT